ncbi:hypothetical protein [uncultured Microbacterium sp.]|uniref:hypothetical protein n=1 Tax=uncultured Microbacterium sp. TaxID=191216 RepID=UPI0025F24B02|nr:hypothetical protein [uncultured Microbacterium sp.]
MDATDCVFHARVELAAGTSSLLPMSDLADTDPAAYRDAIAKYDDTPERQRLRDTVIPGLGRSWTEVVFLSPVHPHAIWQAWFEIRGRRRPPMEFWAIPAQDLPDGTVVLDRTMTATGDPIDPREVERFDREAHRASPVTTAKNRAWLEEMARRGVSGAWFHGIPHVLAPGPVRLDRAHVVPWEVAP